MDSAQIIASPLRVKWLLAITPAHFHPLQTPQPLKSWTESSGVHYSTTWTENMVPTSVLYVPKTFCCIRVGETSTREYFIFSSILKVSSFFPSSLCGRAPPKSPLLLATPGVMTDFLKQPSGKTPWIIASRTLAVLGPFICWYAMEQSSISSFFPCYHSLKTLALLKRLPPRASRWASLGDSEKQKKCTFSDSVPGKLNFSCFITISPCDGHLLASYKCHFYLLYISSPRWLRW